MHVDISQQRTWEQYILNWPENFKSDVQAKITVDINHLAANVQHALPVPLQLPDQMYQLCHTHIAVIICLQDVRIPASFESCGMHGACT